MKVLRRLESSAHTWFLLFISLIFFLLRLPSFFEPYWYGDEGIYETLGLGMNHGRLLYKEIFDNKPPLLYFIYSLFGSDQSAVRFFSFVVGLLSVFVFFFLAKKFFKNTKSLFVSTGVFAVLFGLPLIEGNIANAENFMILPALFSAFLIFKALEDRINHKKLLFAAGFLLGVSFLIKIVAVFDFAAFFAFLTFSKIENLKDLLTKKFWEMEIMHLLSIVSGFLLPIIFVAAIFLLRGGFSDLIRATFFSNIGYVGYGNKLIIPQGLLILKLVLLGGYSLFVFFKRKSFGSFATFVLLWTGFSLFNAFFSQRPYTHYVLTLLPSFCLLLGLLFEKTKQQYTYALIFILTLFLALTNFNYYVKTLTYYPNFISFVFGNKSVAAYEKYFDGSTPRDYALASFINANTTEKDNIFLWGNNAQLYKMTNKLPPGKYTATYHITNYKDGNSDTIAGLKKADPKYIIVMPNVGNYPFPLTNYKLKLDISGAIIYEKISR